MQYAIETITPARAQEYLTHNESNRKVRPGRVAQYAEAMRRGLWHLTGDAITFDSYGRLIQGQHRLLACIEADTDLVTAVVRGVDPAAYTVLDSGLNRAASDAIASGGLSDQNQIAAISRVLLTWRAGIHFTDSTKVAVVVQRDDVVEFALKNGELMADVSRYAKRIKHSIGGNSTAYGALIFELYQGERNDECDVFFDAVVNGVGLDRDDPRLAFRNWVAASYASNPKPGMIPCLMNVTRAWNHYIEGNKISHIKTWKPGSAIIRPIV